MKKINVESNKIKGRATKHMKECFADLAAFANNKRLEGKIKKESDLSAFTQLKISLEEFMKNAAFTPKTPKQRRIVKKVESLLENIDNYLQSSKS